MRIKKLLNIPLFIILVFSTSAYARDSFKQQSWSPHLLYEEWHGVYLRGAKLGFIHSKAEEKEDEYVLNILSYIKTEGFGSTQEISLSQESHMSKEFRAKHFTFIQDMMGHRQTVKGKVIENEMEIETYSAGVASSKKIKFTNNTFLSSDIIFMVIKKGLQVGKTYNLNMFIEPLQSVLPVNIKITGKERIVFKGQPVDTYIIREKMKGLSSRMWVTPDGSAIKEISFEGFEFRKEGRETAVEFKNGIIPVSSLMAISLINTERSIKDASSLKRLNIKVEIQDGGLLPEDHRQKVVNRNGNELKVEIRSEDAAGKGQHKKLLNPSGFERFLGEDHVIQTTHPDIVKKAKEIIGDDTDTWKSAKKINRWVYLNMKKKPVDTFSAMESLRTLEGECQSHTYLFAALARSAGIPAKVVSGIVYSAYYKGFLYHAWPEVYVGRWIAMDPTLGQEIADATHLKLSEGDTDNPLDLLNFIGKLKISIID